MKKLVIICMLALFAMGVAGCDTSSCPQGVCGKEYYEDKEAPPSE